MSDTLAHRFPIFDSPFALNRSRAPAPHDNDDDDDSTTTNDDADDCTITYSVSCPRKRRWRELLCSSRLHFSILTHRERKSLLPHLHPFLPPSMCAQTRLQYRATTHLVSPFSSHPTALTASTADLSPHSQPIMPR
uniref:Uncharacterized protein n=1 Tax=Echinococcus granulosus TaxID=6210 RepID=A0A068WU40_ECHGR|nr:hypothetical protein EgrG_000157300 [Echinococcus granulosus]